MTERAPCGKPCESPEAVQAHVERCEYCNIWMDGYKAGKAAQLVVKIGGKMIHKQTGLGIKRGVTSMAGTKIVWIDLSGNSTSCVEDTPKNRHSLAKWLRTVADYLTRERR